MIKSVLAAAVGALTLLPTAQAADFKVSGQVNQRAVVGGDLKDDISVADNTMSGTRFRFTGETEGYGLTAGFHYELQLRANNSAAGGSTTEEESAGFKSVPGIFSDNEIRWSDVYVKGAFGQVSVGRGEPAASDTADSTYGNGNFYSTPNLVWLAYLGAAVDEGLGSITSRGFDGDTGRISRLQYDSPNFAGFTFALSLGNDANKQYAVRYAGEVGPGKLKVRLGHVDVDNTDKARTASTNVKRTVGSALYQFDFGLNLGGSFGKDDNNEDNDYMHYAIGWKKDKLGASIEMLEHDDDRSTFSWGVTYAVAKNTSAYFNNSTFKDVDGTNKITGSMIGLHYKF